MILIYQAFYHLSSIFAKILIYETPFSKVNLARVGFSSTPSLTKIFTSHLLQKQKQGQVWA
ncbi:MAG: hypothetical protein J6R37_04390 [Clostridia bacterium]|nr:hypothetical protein [Clostridia bacterium]